MKNLILLLVFLGISVYNSKGVDEECLFDISKPCPNDDFLIYTSMLDSSSSGIFETTTVFVDTCNFDYYSGDSICTVLKSVEPILQKEKRYYSNEFFYVTFNTFVFDTLNIDMDSLNYLTVNDIKDEYNELKSALFDLENQTGDLKFYPLTKKYYTLKKSFKNRSSNTFPVSASLFLTLENTINVYDIANIISSLNDIHSCEFQAGIHVPVGIFEDYQKSEIFEIYPNPANNNITLEFNRNVKNIRIINSTGEVYYDFTTSEVNNINANGQMSMNVYHYPSGVYFVIIDNKYYNKFIIER